MTVYDTLIRGGRWFDGTGAPSRICDIGIFQGRVADVSQTPLHCESARVIEAKGHWVLPGFVDVHTHYDAEILVAPGLGESVRHGVTTVFLGSCSLSTVHATPVDCADLFSRVEAVPRPVVLKALEDVKTWTHAEDYVAFLETLPLGPNVAAYLGHSDLRTAVMGLDRAVDNRAKPTEGELQEMETLLTEAMAAGFVGLSTMSNPWDKLAGDRHRSKPLPSTFARWREYRRLNRVLRTYDRVLQGVPNLNKPITAAFFFGQSRPSRWRKALKTSLLTAADPKASPLLGKMVLTATRLLNRWAGTAVQWQHLPVPFEVYADGMDLVVFEELKAGAAALHIASQPERNELLRDENYRRQFRKEYDVRFSPRVWQRDFHDAEIVACPDQAAVGQSIGDIATQRGQHPVDAFLDLVVEHGTALRWRTTIANHRPEVLNTMASLPELQMGFADSGAHLRNMAFYNFSIRFLRRVKQATDAGSPFISLEHAVHRLTGELGLWFGIDAGTLREGDRADIVIIDPNRLDDRLDAYHEAPLPEFGNLSRMVNRGDAVRATLVGGEVVFDDGAFAPGFGNSTKTGMFLRAGEKNKPVPKTSAPAERAA